MPVDLARLAQLREKLEQFLEPIYQFAPPPFWKRSVMHEDLEIRPSAESPGSAINRRDRHLEHLA